MNADPDWQRILGRAKPDKRLQDVELVLRCLALYQFRERYEKPMKEFLNLYMENKRQVDDDYQDLADNFAATTEMIVEALGDKPFHLRKRLNYGVLDSVMYAVLSSDTVIEDLKEKYDALVVDPEYLEAVSVSTSDASAIKTRLDKAVQYLV